MTIKKSAERRPRSLSGGGYLGGAVGAALQLKLLNQSCNERSYQNCMSMSFYKKNVGLLVSNSPVVVVGAGAGADDVLVMVVVVGSVVVGVVGLPLVGRPLTKTFSIIKYRLNILASRAYEKIQ